MKIFNLMIAICCCAEVFGNIQPDSPAIISIMNSEELRIIDQTNNSEFERFHVSIYQNPRKCADGSLQFALKMNFRDFNEDIRFNNEVIEKLGDGKVFYVSIPKNELKNEIFFIDIQLKSDNPNYVLDNIKVKIEPKIEISADQKRVSFGKIYHNGTRLVSAISPEVKIRYSTLKNAVCEVKSENNFRLKSKNNYISYSMNELIENGEIDLSSDRNEYIANFRIADFKTKPAPGNYSDKITFSIKTHL